MKIAIGADHAGFLLKEKIKEHVKPKINVKDFGTFDESSVDYPDFAKAVSKSVIKKECSFGILICGTGIGMSIAANKIKGVYAALCHNEYTAKMAREHNNANILTLGSRTLSDSMAFKIVDIFLETDFEGGRHIKRLKKIEKRTDR